MGKWGVREAFQIHEGSSKVSGNRSPMPRNTLQLIDTNTGARGVNDRYVGAE